LVLFFKKELLPCFAGAREMIAIVWFRRDLRLNDNPALQEAVRQSAAILPLFVLPTEAPGEFGGAARWWLHGSLEALGSSLAAKGARLVLRRGDPAAVVRAVAAEAGASVVHAGLCPDPVWRAADAAAGTALTQDGRRLELHPGLNLFDPALVRTKSGGIYGMFTPFARATEAFDVPPPVPAPARLAAFARKLRTDDLADWKLRPSRPDWAGGLRATWVPGEASARARARMFLRRGLAGYETGRDVPGQDLTSRLSPHLRWGEISVRWLWREARAAPPGAGRDTFARELIWRDFAAYLLWHNPRLGEMSLRERYEKLPWRDDRKALRAWTSGHTGIPIVDAGMRQLWQTGWMHNRVRMIVGSFLVKHLLVDWRAGAAWFMDTLVDADPAANSMNWQWVAGTGIDSQPFFRIFNPVSQGTKFDPKGEYVRRFVPEIARLPDKYIHAPWTAPESACRDAGIALGREYPRPVVDLAEARTRALAAWRNTTKPSS
jgi:deoxyribodipyrimidine photo-lyase